MANSRRNSKPPSDSQSSQNCKVSEFSSLDIELRQQMEQLRRANEASYLEVQRLTGELNDRLNQSFQS